MKRAYADIPEGQVHYQAEGSGEPLLLLHQTGISSDEYSKMMPLLGKTYRVIAMDTLGYGKSDKPPEGFQIKDYAQSVINFLKALDISRTSIVGHLTGSAIAVELAATNPDLVDKLILCDCPFYSPEMRESRLKDAKFAPWEAKADGSHLTEHWQYFKSYAPHASPESINTVLVATLEAGPRVHDGHHVLFRYEMEKRLPLLKSPTLLISGTEAPVQERIEAAKSLIPRCRLKIIEGGGDLLPMERTDECVQAMLEFLKNPGV